MAADIDHPEDCQVNGRAWTAEHTAVLLRMARAGYTNAEIAAHTGHCVETVRRQRRDRQIDSCYRAPWWGKRRFRLTFKVTSP